MEVYLCTIMLQNHKWGADKTPDWEIEALISKIAPLGYDGIEIWGYHITNKTEDEVRGIGELLKTHNLKTGVLAPYLRLAESDASVAESLAEAEKFIRFADILDCKKIRYFTGAPGSAEADEEHWTRCVESTKKVCDLAGMRDLEFVAETHANMLTDTVPTTLRLVKEVNHPAFKINFQPSTFREDDPVALYEELKDHTTHIHANNFSVDQGITLLEEGAIPWSGFLEHLKTTGYDGTFSVEFVKGSTAPEDEYDRDAVLTAAGTDRKFISRVMRRK